MTLISTAITIDAPPSKVRDTFLQFKTFSSWASFIVSISAKDEKKDAEIESYADLQPGERLVVKLQEKEGAKSLTTFTPILLQNTPQVFEWKGSLLFDFIFWGAHKFEFKPIENGLKTELVQSEQFGGLLASILLLFFGPRDLFIRFNNSIKRQVEST